MRLLIVLSLVLFGCGKHGYHEAPACNRDFTVTSSGSGGGLAPYWFTVAGSGMLNSMDLKAVGSTVCLYVE